MSEVLVSVIVPAYNQAGLIGRTLDSILAQECDFGFEVIVGDDGSTDGTADVVRRYEREHPDRVRLIARPENVGLQANYFGCIEKARGKYLADCGGDDQWTDPLKLKHQVELMEADPDMAICHTGWCYYHEPTGTTTPSEPTQAQWPELKAKSAPGELFMPLLTRRPTPLLHLCTALWRRDIFMEEYQADPDLFLCKDFGLEDLQIMTVMARRGSVGYLPQVTMAYSVGKPSISTPEPTVRHWRYVRGSLLAMKRLADKYAVTAEAMAQTYDDRLRILTGVAFALGDADLSRQTRELAARLERRLPTSGRMKLRLAGKPLGRLLLKPYKALQRWRAQ